MLRRTFYFTLFMILLPVTLFANEDLPKVKIVATGGTICQTYDEEKGGYVPALTGKQIVESVPKLKNIASIEVVDVAKVGSADMNTEIWLSTHNQVQSILKEPNVDGVVITHGTDTMEETAYFLDLTLKSEKPVVLVGALRGSDQPDADGPRNLLNAVRVAVSKEAHGKGVMVVMNGEIHAAKDVTKTHTYNVGTFKSPGLGPLGYVERLSGKPSFFRAPLGNYNSIPIDKTTKLGRVEVVFHYGGPDPRMLNALADQDDLAGLVIAGTGVGNTSKELFKKSITKLRKKDIPVVITSRVATGPVTPLYGSPGRGQSTKEIGCVLDRYNLEPWKARILLMLALTQTNDPDELQKYFELP